MVVPTSVCVPCMCALTPSHTDTKRKKRASSSPEFSPQDHTTNKQSHSPLHVGQCHLWDSDPQKLSSTPEIERNGWPLELASLELRIQGLFEQIGSHPWEVAPIMVPSTAC